MLGQQHPVWELAPPGQKPCDVLVPDVWNPLGLEGWVERFALVVDRVVTEQRKLQARLLHHERMAAFGLMSAGIAHDLANPLSAIAMHVDLLGGEELPEDASDSLTTIRSEVARLGRTLREMVDFARRRRTEECLVDVESVAQDAVRLLRHDPRTRGACCTARPTSR